MDILSDVNIVGRLSTNSLSTNSLSSKNLNLTPDSGNKPRVSVNTVEWFGQIDSRFTTSPSGVATRFDGTLVVDGGEITYGTVPIMKTTKIDVPENCSKFLIQSFCSYSCYAGVDYNNYPIVQLVDLSTREKVETTLEFIRGDSGSNVINLTSTIIPRTSASSFAVSIVTLP